ncbi:MAG TPA: MCE family protein, partial [Verrucomicrobiales bacterium]|nr:MCE family protein [Verrucomicrobiales bacterium]HIL68366.1 MCE family protein [Verrucomicrobiota bacterium]
MTLLFIMKANLKDYVSAILVIACSLVLLAAIQYGLTGKGFTDFTRFVEVDIEDATGLRLHSEVRYAGAIIGRITDIRYLSEEEIEKSPNPANLIHITGGLDDSAPELPENLTASPAAETLLGEKFLGLKPKGVAKGKLKEGQVVQGNSGLSIDDLIRQIQPTLENVTEITAQVRNDLPGMTGQLDGVLSEVRSLLEKAENG